MSTHDRQGAGAGVETLDRWPVGTVGVVSALRAPGEAPEWARLLDEIGFTVGERVEVMVRGVPGGDPLAVRIGDSTFALRRAEAACIEVCREMSLEGGAQ